MRIVIAMLIVAFAVAGCATFKGKSTFSALGNTAPIVTVA